MEMYDKIFIKRKVVYLLGGEDNKNGEHRSIDNILNTHLSVLHILSQPR